jgi:hypothetical protein
MLFIFARIPKHLLLVMVRVDDVGVLVEWETGPELSSVRSWLLPPDGRHDHRPRPASVAPVTPYPFLPVRQRKSPHRVRCASFPIRTHPPAAAPPAASPPPRAHPQPARTAGQRCLVLVVLVSIKSAICPLPSYPKSSPFPFPFPLYPHSRLRRAVVSLTSLSPSPPDGSLGSSRSGGLPLRLLDAARVQPYP